MIYEEWKSFITIKNVFERLFRRKQKSCFPDQEIVFKLPDSYCTIYNLHAENVEQTKLCALRCPHSKECEFYLNCILKGNNNV